MIPFGPFAVMALLILPPGWLYLKVAGWRRPQGRGAGLSEVIDLAGAGTGALAAGITISGLCSVWWSPPLLDVRDWLAAADRSRYVHQHVPEVLSSSAVAFLASITAAIVFALMFTRRSRTGLQPPASLATHALGKLPKGRQPWVCIERDDDTAIEGVLLGYSYSTDRAGVDVAVRSPIYVTPPGRPPEGPNLDRVLVPGKRIRTVSVHAVRPTPAGARGGGGGGGPRCRRRRARLSTVRQAHRRPPADQPHPPGTTWAPPLQTVRRRHPAPVPGMHTGADPERPSRGPHHRLHPQDAASPGTGSTTPSGRTAHNTRSGGSPRPNCSFRRTQAVI